MWSLGKQLSKKMSKSKGPRAGAVAGLNCKQVGVVEPPCTGRGVGQKIISIIEVRFALQAFITLVFILSAMGSHCRGLHSDIL